jgi:hypothetical protein
MRRNAVFFLLLVSACGAAPPAALTRCVGTYEWFSTFGTGRLDLGEDGCYRLTLQNPQHDAPRELVGNWRMAACNWGEQDRGGMVELDLPKPTLPRTKTERADPLSGLASCTSLLASVSEGHADYLGADGVIDLNQGF